MEKLGIPHTTFYRWYDRYHSGGPEALEDQSPRPQRVWNRIPDKMRQRIVALALDACASGVDRVHFVDGSQDGILLQEVFSSTGHGTMFYANQYDKIRPARPEDVAEARAGTVDVRRGAVVVRVERVR